MTEATLTLQRASAFRSHGKRVFEQAPVDGTELCVRQEVKVQKIVVHPQDRELIAIVDGQAYLVFDKSNFPEALLATVSMALQRQQETGTLVLTGQK